MQRTASPRAARLSGRILAPLLVALVAATAAPATADAAMTGRERAVIRLINKVRAAHHLQPLKLSPLLAHAARAHSQLEARDDTLGHQLSGEEALPSRVASAARKGTVGEAVFWSRSRSTHAARIVAAFLASPPHRKLLLSAHFHRVGVGIDRGAGGVFATVDFAHASG